VNVVDSSGWLEYFGEGPGAGFFASALEDTERLVVPTICIVEVFKVILRQRGESAALGVVAAMEQARVVDLDTVLSLSAAKLGVAHKLPLADSIVLATARAHTAILWTQDGDFEGLEGVRYRKKG
jgi:predicted nucleic acid-binding protein